SISVTATKGAITMADAASANSVAGEIVYSASGGINLGQLNSTSGAITVTAGSGTSAGAITTNLTDLTKPNLNTTALSTLSAQTGIGSTGPPILIGSVAVTGSGSLTATNYLSGAIAVSAASNLVVDGSGIRTLAGNGNISLTAVGNITVSDPVSA